MKLKLVALLYLLMCSSIASYAQEEWVNIEKKGNDYSQFYDIGTDSFGNVYATGSAQQATFDANALAFTDKLFIAKFNSRGQNIWVKSLGNINSVYGKPLLSVKPNGEVFVTSRYSELGETILGQALPPAYAPIYAAKLDSNGTVMWLKQVPFGGFQYQETYISSIASDGAGNCYINFSHGRNSNNNAYAVITKINGSTGAFMWEKVWQGKNVNNDAILIRAISVDTKGNIFATGDFFNQLNMGDSTITDNTGHTIFVAKFDSLGKRQWIRLMKSERAQYTGNTIGGEIAVSKDGKTLYTSGMYFVSYTGQAPQYQFDGLAPKKDGSYIAMMEPSSGRFIWVKSVGGDFLKIDASDNCYFAGGVSGDYMVQDSIPLSLEGFSTYNGISKVDKTGKFFPILPIGENVGVSDFDIFDNRVIYTSYLPSNTTLYFNYGKQDVTTNRAKIFIGSVKLPTNDFSIKIDSISTEGECFEKPLKYKLKTSTFREGNRFVVQMTKSGQFNSVYMDSTVITATSLDSFSKILNNKYYYNSDYNELDSISKIRVCSTNPVTCSPAYNINNPIIGLVQAKVCKGDTIRLLGQRALSYEWSASNANFIDSKTIASPRVKADTTTDFTVKVKTKLGCTTTYTRKATVTYMTLGFLKDTVNIPCNSPDDIVNLQAGVTATNSIYDNTQLIYSWQPTSNIVNSDKTSILVSPMRTTKYFVSILDTFNKCTFKDSVLVKVDTCKIIYGKTNPNNIVSALIKLPNSLGLNTLKQKKADSLGNYLLRLPQSNVRLQTKPEGILGSLVPTYYDSVLTMQKARLLTHTTDTIKADIYGLKRRLNYTNNNLKGVIYDYYDPSRAIPNLDLVLVDTNIYRVLKGELSIDSLEVQYSTTNSYGKYNFPNVKLGKPYLIWANRFGINNELAPSFIAFKTDELEKVIYLKDSVLINCSAAGSPCGSITGNVFISSFGTECSADFSTARIQHMVKLEPVNLYTSTDSSGKYLFRVPPSTYSVVTNTPKYYTQNICTTNGSYTNVVVSKDTTISCNFGLSRMGNIYDYATELTTATPFRPGFETQVTLSLLEQGNKSTSNTLIVKYPYDKMNLVSSNVTSFMDTTIKGEIKWSYFNGIDNNYLIKMQFKVLPTARLGDSITMYSDAILDYYTDSLPLNNKDTLKQIIVGSFDPNDKQVEPSGSIPPSVEDFTFTIRFQNTGTDTAFNIVVRDTLDAVWNPQTLTNIAASHPYKFVVKEKGIIEWHFNNILLQDSFHNEKASHGFIKFKIKPQQIPLSIGAKLQNKAGIYFDFNAPVVTNTTSNLVTKQTSAIREIVSDIALIYPNPASSHLIIELKDVPQSNSYFEIYNSIGQLVVKNKILTTNHTIDTHTLHTGLYFIKIYNGEKVQTKEFIIEK